MNVWNKAPFVRLILPFLAGIIIAIYLPFQFKYSIYIIVALVAIISLFVLIPRLNISYRKSRWFGLLVNSTLLLFSNQLTIFKTEKFANNHFSKYTDGTQYVYIRLTEPYLEKEKSLKAVVEVLSVKQGDQWKNTCGKAMVHFKKNAHSLQLAYGDELLMKADFKEVPSPQNPGEFNYKRFLAFHNVFHQAYIQSCDWAFSGRNSGNSILRTAIDLRNNLLNVFITNHIQNNEYAVGSALLLGYVDKLDADIISAYASTGALHVLSVSGLHVAIVYVVFNWLLFFFNKIKYGLIIKAVILFLLIWFYATLTGLSPSVLRSAAMFSFIIVAKAFDRNTNIYNTLAASAFFLLLFNPYFIMDVGFQLSYIAVIGIVYIQPMINKLLEVNNWFLDQVWSITSVSIAAQIATFPLGLYYFHQFPNYFLLSNFIVIPVSTVIIYLGLSVFAFAKISILVKYLAMGFGWSVWLLNSSVQLIETWPYALLQGISITVFETLLLYGLIISLLHFFTKQQFKYIVFAMSIGVIILVSQLVEQHNQFNQKKLIVYNIPKTSAIDFISAKTNVLLTDTAFAKNESGLKFHVKNNWTELGMNNTTIISSDFQTNNLTVNSNFIQFYDKRMAIVNENGLLKSRELFSLKPLLVDYLIVSKNPRIRISEIVKQYNAKIIVFDSSNPEYAVNKWKAECIKLNQRYYSVMESGALVADL